jgi:hypothetical protein
LIDAGFVRPVMRNCFGKGGKFYYLSLGGSASGSMGDVIGGLVPNSRSSNRRAACACDVAVL